ncbi:MAG: hypothetical protein AAGC88_11200 [Bacteroidota bacterium]
MEITAVTGSSFSFNYKYQPDGSNTFGSSPVNPSTLSENFDSGTGIPEPNYSGQLTFGNRTYQASSLSESFNGGVGGTIAIILDGFSSYLELPALDQPQSISFQHALVSGFEAAFQIRKSVNGGTFQVVGGDQSNGTNFSSFSFVVNESNANVVLRIYHNGGLPMIMDDLVVGQPVVQPVVTITSPNGGETWEIGSMQTISWEQVGFGLEDNLAISFSTNGNDGPFAQIATGVPTDFDGSYSWTIPDNAGTAIFVKVENISLTVSDLSDAAFTIFAPIAYNFIEDFNGFDTNGPTFGQVSLSSGQWSFAGASNGDGPNTSQTVFFSDGADLTTPATPTDIEAFTFDYYSAQSGGTVTITGFTSTDIIDIDEFTIGAEVTSTFASYTNNDLPSNVRNIKILYASSSEGLHVDQFSMFYEEPTCTEGEFLGTVDDDWDNPANWCNGVIPSPANVTQNIVLVNDLEISELADFVLNGAELNVGDGLELNIDLNNNQLVLQNGATFTNTGIVTFANGTRISDPNGGFTNNGTVKGGGTFINNFTNGSSGTLAPGFTPGCMDFQSDFTNAGTLEIEIDCVAIACTDYDQITVTGTANLGGTLEVILGMDYTLADGDEIVIIDAGTIADTFVSVDLPDDNWSINYDSPSDGEVSLVYFAPTGGSLITGTATSSAGSGFDFSTQVT